MSQYDAVTVNKQPGDPACCLSRVFTQITWSPDRPVQLMRWAQLTDIRYLRQAIEDVAVVTAPAEIDITNAGCLREALRQAARRGRPAVVVDMTGTVFCDSAGLHTLVRAHKQVVAQGNELRLVVPAHGGVRRILTLTGLDRFLSCFTSLEEALAQTPDPADRQAGAGEAAEHANATIISMQL
jgi:anti-sigma B factor antagonist